MIKQKIAIIGNGNMGQAIVQALLRKKTVTNDQLILTNSQTKNNKIAVQKADVIILAIKPQISSIVLEEIKDVVKNQLIISIMAGVSIDTIQKIIGKKIAVVRVMPNLAAKIGKSMSVWVRSKEVTNDHALVTKTILGAIGAQLEVQNEKQINMTTAISGSGPAYFFYITEVIEKEAVKLGFTQEEARLLAKQTLLGSAGLLQASYVSAKELRQKVTSKGGTTEAALQTFEKRGLKQIIHEGILAAVTRAKELGSEKIS